MWLVLWYLSQLLSYTTASVNGSTIRAVIAAQSMRWEGGGRVYCRVVIILEMAQIILIAKTAKSTAKINN